MPWVLVSRRATLAPAVRSTTRTVPGAAPERMASTTMARSAPSHRPEQVEGVDEGADVDRRRSLGDAARGHGRAGAVVAPVLVPDSGHHDAWPVRASGAASRRESVPGHDGTTVTSRKWAAHEMQGSWLRTACSQRHCSSSSPSSSAPWATRRRSASMVSWFCEVGGTMRAHRIVPEPSISYWWKSSPRGASVAPVPEPGRGVTGTDGRGGRV